MGGILRRRAQRALDHLSYLRVLYCAGGPAVPPSQYLVADKGYDSNALRLWLSERGTERRL
ncbi:hypothetical protein TomTYG45_28460 [Sphingobium sp. TomTYG45]